MSCPPQSAQLVSGAASTGVQTPLVPEPVQLGKTVRAALANRNIPRATCPFRPDHVTKVKRNG